MTIDLKKIITEYPDCLQNSQKLKAVISDLFPQCSQGLVRILVSFVEEKFVEEISSANSVSEMVHTRWKRLLEDKYGYSQRLVEQAVDLWNSVFHEKQQQQNSDDFTIENGVLTAYKGNSSSVVIPDGVTSINWNVFQCCRFLTNVTMPSSVTRIGYGAFEGCTSLVRISLSDRITELGPMVFMDCISLKSITVPDGVTSIENGAFSGCISLTNITIPDSVTEIGEYTFAKCTSLTSITIPDSVTEIGSNAFSDCVLLKSIRIPAGVKKMGPRAFDGCSGLKHVVFGNIYGWRVTDRNSDLCETIGCDLLANPAVALETLILYSDYEWEVL